MKNIAVFASGSGTNYEAIAKAVEAGEVHANIALVVCDNPSAYVIERAKGHGHKLFVFNPKDFAKKKEYEKLILEQMVECEIDLIVMAGYMRILSKSFLDKFKGKVLNIHPALLPAFKGAHAILDAYNFGVKVYGITIHFIDETIDGGVIVEQAAYHAKDGESLEAIEAEIHKLEHLYYPKTIEKILKEY